MAEFINLDHEEESLNISPYSKTPIITILPGSEIIDGNITQTELSGIPTEDVISIDIKQGYVEEIEESICIHESCDASTYYGDANEDDSFKRSNLFSELTDEYQRAVARQNLGIADDYTLLWGNISGNLVNQTDLYRFILDTIASEYNELIFEINLKLGQWGYEIRNELSQKANILSPDFKGTPTTTLPEISDYSNRIPTTEWVTAKINEATTNDVLFFSSDKTYMYYGDSPQNISCQWDYRIPIISQKINGVSLGISDRTYTFIGVDSDLIITLEYTTTEGTYTKNITFNKYYPVYYGTSEILDELSRTKDNEIILNCNENDYAYIYVPNKSSTRIAVDGLVGGFFLIGTVQLHSLTYYVFKSANSGLGELFINIL